MQSRHTIIDAVEDIKSILAEKYGKRIKLKNITLDYEVLNIDDEVTPVQVKSISNETVSFEF